MRQTGLEPDLLQIELTESVMLNGIEPAVDTMKRMRALGVTLAIDDFGTGYSCFSYLPKLPFNTLKIDRVLVNDRMVRPEMKALVQSLVGLAHNLNMQVVVEGIETVEQLEMITALGATKCRAFCWDVLLPILRHNSSPQLKHKDPLVPSRVANFARNLDYAN